MGRPIRAVREPGGARLVAQERPMRHIGTCMATEHGRRARRTFPAPRAATGPRGGSGQRPAPPGPPGLTPPLPRSLSLGANNARAHPSLLLTIVAATGHPALPRLVQEHRRRRPLLLRASEQAGTPSSCRIESSPSSAVMRTPPSIRSTRASPTSSGLLELAAAPNMSCRSFPCFSLSLPSPFARAR